MWVSVNKLNLIPERIVSRRNGVFWNGGGLGSSKPSVSVVFFNPFMHRSSRFSNIDLATLTGTLVYYSVLFFLSIVSFGRTVVGRFNFRHRFFCSCLFLYFRNVFHKRKTIQNENWWEVFLLLRDNWWFSPEVFLSIVQALVNTAFTDCGWCESYARYV